MLRRTAIVLLCLAIAPAIVSSCSKDKVTNPKIPLDMQTAIDKVKREIIPNAVPEGAQYVCLRMDGSIAAGSTIEEDAPSGGVSGIRRVARTSVPISEESYFFYLDLSPGAYYAHPVKYIVVGKGGSYQVVDARWWPRINGQIPAQIQNPVPDSHYIVDANVDIKPPVGIFTPIQFPSPGGQSIEGFFAVEGLTPGQPCYSDAWNTYENAIDFFNMFKNSISTVDGVIHEDAANILAKIHTMATEEKQVITIFIIAHGDVDEIRLGDQTLTANQFREELSGHPATDFNFLLGACHSGSFRDNLETLSNVHVLLTACGTNEGADADIDTVGPYFDLNPEDTGSEWSSSLFHMARLLVQDAEDWGLIRTWASAAGVTESSMLFCCAEMAALGYDNALGDFDCLDLSVWLQWANPVTYSSFTWPRGPLPVLTSEEQRATYGERVAAGSVGRSECRTASVESCN